MLPSSRSEAPPPSLSSPSPPQNYDEAQSLFEDILTKDPFRLEASVDGGVESSVKVWMSVRACGSSPRLDVCLV